MTISHVTALRNSFCTSFGAAVDAAATAGKLNFYTANFASLMVSIAFNDPSFGSPSNGSIAMETPAISGTISLAGTNTMAKFKILDGDDTEVVQGDVGLAGADINLTSVTFNQNDSVTINSLTYTAAT
jgi:hypothetical protein